MVSKDMLAPKEMSRQELKSLVDQWVADGGVIKQIPPGVALNFRSAEVENNPVQSKRRFPGLIVKAKAVGKKNKSKKKKR